MARGVHIGWHERAPGSRVSVRRPLRRAIPAIVKVSSLGKGANVSDRHRRRLRRPSAGFVLLVAIVILGIPAAAQAKWGPSSNCGIKSNPVDEHCYAIAVRTGVAKYASIAAEDNEVASVTDWEGGGFITNEQWIGFGSITSTWIENGIIMGNYRDCCTAYPFYAWENSSEGFQKYETTGPVESGSGKYNFDMLYDETVNGHWKAYWSAATNKAEWFSVKEWTGWPYWYTEQEAGMEAASEYAPYHAGRDEVAAANKAPSEFWGPWTGATYENDPGVCIGHNRESGAAGNIEWTPGHNSCKAGEL
jgi:hypothetical protein